MANNLDRVLVSYYMHSYITEFKKKYYSTCLRKNYHISNDSIVKEQTTTPLAQFCWWLNFFQTLISKGDMTIFLGYPEHYFC